MKYAAAGRQASKHAAISMWLAHFITSGVRFSEKKREREPRMLVMRENYINVSIFFGQSEKSGHKRWLCGGSSGAAMTLCENNYKLTIRRYSLLYCTHINCGKIIHIEMYAPWIKSPEGFFACALSLAFWSLIYAFSSMFFDCVYVSVIINIWLASNIFISHLFSSFSLPVYSKARVCKFSTTLNCAAKIKWNKTKNIRWTFKLDLDLGTRAHFISTFMKSHWKREREREREPRNNRNKVKIFNFYCL